MPTLEDILRAAGNAVPEFTPAGPEADTRRSWREVAREDRASRPDRYEPSLECRSAACIVWSPESEHPPSSIFSGPQALRVAESMAERHPDQRFYVAHLVACSPGPLSPTAVKLATLRAAWGPFASCLAVAGVLAAGAWYVTKTLAVAKK